MSTETICFGSCPTCGAFAQHIAGEPETWRHTKAQPPALHDDLRASYIEKLQAARSMAPFGSPEFAVLDHAIAALTALTTPSREAEGWASRYSYALVLIDAAEADGDGIAGVAFSAHVPSSLIDGKSNSEIVAMMCEDAFPMPATQDVLAGRQESFWRSPAGRIKSEADIRFYGTDTTGWTRLKLENQPAPQPALSTPAGEAVACGELDRSAPPKVWLQVDTNGDPDDRSEAVPSGAWDEVSWHYEPIGGQEVEYIRADLAYLATPQPTTPASGGGKADAVAGVIVEAPYTDAEWTALGHSLAPGTKLYTTPPAAAPVDALLALQRYDFIRMTDDADIVKDKAGDFIRYDELAALIAPASIGAEAQEGK